MGYTNVFILLGLLVVFVTPMVFADDVTPIPESKPQVAQWFNANVGPLAQRKGLDPALVAAEAAPRIINVLFTLIVLNSSFVTIDFDTNFLKNM